MKLTIEYKKNNIYLNPLLVTKQQLTQERVDKILALHVQKSKLIDALDELDVDKNLVKAKFLSQCVTRVEFELQKNWGFTQDASYHRWWLLPGCKCPKIDNEERYTTAYKIVASNCPLHGKE